MTTISAVGSLVASAGTNLTVNPTTVGDILVFVANAKHTGSGGVYSITGLSHPGVTTWTQLRGDTVAGTNLVRTEIWYGVITATGSGTLAVTASKSGSPTAAFAAQQFTGGGDVTWSADGSGGTAGSQTAATSGNYPSLTPAAAGELYVGVALVGGTAAGSTSGYTYNSGTGGGFEADSEFVYNPNVAASAQSPAWSSASSYWGASAALLVATASGATANGNMLACL